MEAAAAQRGRLAGLAVVILPLALAACTAGTPGGAGASSPPAGTATTASPTPIPGSSTSATSGNGTFGAGCASMPEFGANSVEGVSKEDILAAANRSPQLSTLVTAVKQSRLADTLTATDDITVFAPNNKAFEREDATTLARILASRSRLTDTLLLHVVPGRLSPAQLPGTHRTLSGESITVQGSSDEFQIDGKASIVCGNVQTANGVVYVIDQVLLPS